MAELTFAPKADHEDRPLKSIETLQRGAKILVAGAGVFGSWTALMLQESGFEVTLADPWGPGNSRSSSGGENQTHPMHLWQQ